MFQISLEFYQKKRTRWLFPSDCSPWEVWTLKINVICLPNEHGKITLLYFISIFNKVQPFLNKLITELIADKKKIKIFKG